MRIECADHVAKAMNFTEDYVIECIDIDSLSRMPDAKAQEYLQEMQRTQSFNEHLFIERTFYVLEPMIAEEE